jgi:glycosyltransferase involved in cell wall biosynthesis
MVAAMLVSDYGVAGEIITVACPGNDPMRRARGSRDKTTNLLSVGAVVPRKGYDVLVAALSKIADLPWRLAIAGDCGRDAATTAALRSQIARSNLTHRITLAGAVSDAALAALYVGADVFVLPSRFEGYGMAFTEAIACGLPVIGTTSGAVPQTIPAGAGILVPPDDVAALADALRRVIEDAKLRMDFAAAAGRAAEQLPTWKAAARRIAAVLETVA